MTISPETRAELRRLRAEANAAHAIMTADGVVEDPSIRHDGLLRAYARLKNVASPLAIPLLDALEAAEAERDRMRADVDSYQSTISRCENEGQKNAATIVRLRAALREIGSLAERSDEGHLAPFVALEDIADEVTAALGEQP